MKPDDKFTRIASDLCIDVRDLVNWGIDKGLTTPDQMRWTIAARREAAVKLIESGMSQRQTAKLLGVDQSTIHRDVMHIASKSDAKRIKKKKVATQNAQLKLVHVEPPQKTYGTIVIDPPWEVEKIERVVRPNQVGFDYPTMTEDELAQFKVASMAAEDCHLFCWSRGCAGLGKRHRPIPASVLAESGNGR